LKRLGRRGVAAVEFAICAPMLVLLIIGTLEVLMLYRTEEKLNSLAGNFAEMVSNQEIASVNSSGVTLAHSPVPASTSGANPPGLSDLCAGAVDGLQPFPANGLAIDVASVTKTGTTSTSYDEWEIDLSSNCAPAGTQLIGSTAALSTATGNGGSTALVLATGDNVIIVRATLQYPGFIGMFITSAQSLTQTAIARWRYASATNITNIAATPAPAATLEFLCSGTGCMTNTGV